MSHRVLVIDHHPHGLERVVRPLRKAGYEVAVARTVADGASKFGSFEPALVFIAARLPRTHGTVLCRELKRTDAGAHTPIVLIVEGTGVQIDLPPLDQFGADRLIQKPVAADELLALCGELLDDGLDGVVHDRDPALQSEEPDDGLSIALEELDALNFDLPEEGAGATSGAPSSIRLSADVGEEIESHIDGLLTDVNRVTPKPSTGRDHDADSAVIEQLDLEQDLKSRRRTDTGSPAKPPGRATARTPATAPPRPRGDTQPERPAAATTTADLPSRQTAGKFQTEAFTRKDLHQPFPAVAEVQTEGGLARWSWIAIPLTVVIVFAAVLLMARPRPVSPVVSGPPPSTGVDSANPGTLQADPSALPLRPLDDPAPFAAAAAAAAAELAASSRPTSFIEPDPAESLDASDTPVEARPQPVRTPVAPAQRPDPQPSRTAHVTPRDDPPVTVDRQPIVEPPPPAAVEEPAVDEPEVRAPEPEIQVPIVEPEPSVEEPPVPEFDTETPSSAPPMPDLEPVAPELDPEPVHEPITREAVLIARVEPTVSKKDLKKGKGTVVLKLRISETGTVTRVLVERGIPGSPLEAASVAAVLRWRYEPALDQDEPVESWTIATFTFD